MQKMVQNVQIGSADDTLQKQKQQPMQTVINSCQNMFVKDDSALDTLLILSQKRCEAGVLLQWFFSSNCCGLLWLTFHFDISCDIKRNEQAPLKPCFAACNQDENLPQRKEKTEIGNLFRPTGLVSTLVQLNELGLKHLIYDKDIPQ